MAACNAFAEPEWPKPHEDEIWTSFNGEHIILDNHLDANSESKDDRLIYVYATLDVAKTSEIAVNFWNEKLGAEVLRFTPNQKKAHITVLLQPKTPRYLAYVAAAKNKRFMVLTYWWMNDTTIHEFGHALGLAHDPDNHRSVMTPYHSDAILPNVEAKDIAVLRRYYLGNARPVPLKDGESFWIN